MRNLSYEDCLRLRRELSSAIPREEALSKCIGATQAAGVWRLFSENYPKGGVTSWNSASGWKHEWELAPTSFHSFGEDLFGNQLILLPTVENAYLWNHEDAQVFDLLLDPVTLLETVLESGLDWIDFYNDGSLRIAESRFMDVPPQCHLHWTNPLILGGAVTIDNTSIVERTMHLVGHAKLWRQVRGCEPGTTIVPMRKRTSDGDRKGP